MLFLGAIHAVFYTALYYGLTTAIPLQNSSSYHDIQYPLVTKRFQLDPATLECSFGTKRPDNQPHPGRVIDIILFNNEWDVLEARIYEYEQIVDYFIILENDITFTGKPKTRTLEYLVQERLQEFAKKIVIVDGSKIRQQCEQSQEMVKKMETAQGRDAAFNCEISSRNALIDSVPDNIQPNDYVIMSDADEIIDLHFLRALKYCTFENSAKDMFATRCIGFDTRAHHYSLHWPIMSKDIRFPVTTCLGSTLTGHGGRFSLQNVKNNMMRRKPITWDFQGWHLSYVGSARFIRNKLMSYAETQTNHPPYNTLSYIIDHAHKGVELLERGDLATTYRDQDKVEGPWFALVNSRFRPRLHAYSIASDTSRVLPVCIVLPTLDSTNTNLHTEDNNQNTDAVMDMNHFGHHLFAISNVIAKSYLYGIPYVLPPNTLVNGGNSHTNSFWHAHMFERVLIEAFNEEDCLPTKPLDASYNLQEKDPYASIPDEIFTTLYTTKISTVVVNNNKNIMENINNNVNTSITNSIIVQGAFINTHDIFLTVDILRHRYITYHGQQFHTKYPQRNICLSFPNKLLHDSSIEGYYHAAIDKILAVVKTKLTSQDKSINVHYFGSDAVNIHLYVEKLQSKFKQDSTMKHYTWPLTANVNNNNDHILQLVEQVQYLMQCDDYILYNNLPHVFAAYLSGNHIDSQVVFPMKADFDWFKALVHPTWMGLQA